MPCQHSADGAEKVMSMGFEVSGVQKPLAAVWRIAEKGNLVQFGPGKEDNFIKNVATGDETETMYAVMTGKRWGNGCCFDYGAR